MARLDLVILADLHYVGPAGTARPLPERKGKLGLELALRAVRDALRHGRPDAIVLLGDMVEDGAAPGAADDLVALRDALRPFEVPLIVVPGNHDRDAERVAEIFDFAPGLHTAGDYAVVTFADEYDAADVCTRPAGQMEALARAARDGRPLIAIQHPPLLPRIVSSYPYTIVRAEGLAETYAQAGVVLSLSGHYHAGRPAVERSGVTFAIAPALCERPFRYTRVRLDGRRVVSIEDVPLAPPDLAEVFDAHVHTEFAYCAEDITIEATLERMAALGLGAIGLCEHSDQLYFPEDGFWKRTDAQDPAAVRQAVADGHGRHARYRERVRQFRSERVLLGLEVEPSQDGRGLATLDEDLEGYDYLIGAVHYLARSDDPSVSQAEIARRFMERTEQLARSGVDVLAHPFRFFRRTKRPVPRELFRPVADLLAAHGVAAEINFHTNQPDPEFFALCLECGVHLSVGSDSHALVEVGELRPHIELLKTIGAWEHRAEVLWRPSRK